MREVRIEGVHIPGPGRALRLEVDGRTLAVDRVDGVRRATGGGCPHVGGRLDRGRLLESRVTCPRRGSPFDLATGTVARGPATAPPRVYVVRRDADALSVTVP